MVCFKNRTLAVSSAQDLGQWVALGAWGSECVSVWVCECVSVWVCEWVCECVSVWVCEWACECVCVWVTSAVPCQSRYGRLKLFISLLDGTKGTCSLFHRRHGLLMLMQIMLMKIMLMLLMLMQLMLMRIMLMKIMLMQTRLTQIMLMHLKKGNIAPGYFMQNCNWPISINRTCVSISSSTK